ncbi:MULTISPECIES: putative toxin-antitoxin system toxin component, PIN family [Leptospira]|uniref:Toxin-antitoxin system toxin component, PIN family n=2 Tax=Leptospira licerasiae TaxID=447106 RepID=A0ABN0HEL7_9LEPT|nr:MULTISPECIES: putative toxin-antitoxin system toxin component, PIN family [Leptospira]EIE01055.1 toxin-antitoxin system toxin component, PIN family [Leptospira licerasiae serovar Varillal str. VAR 010]EIE01154.1 toxin-antitoxin system toxin component, PIN family [Leptospira licerasiae serovar Varillal str. VAR 010]EIE03481.1 toxin-antitoxin system toxin component, PIN family [Leptospira licerasiae serovar Varillal str. VAR 010]EJZ44000.1 toxin-antitoxin system toxin component, PIN family [Le
MLKVLIDTNVYISAILFGGKPKVILEELISGKIIGYISDSILKEIEETLKKPKFKLSEEFISIVLSEIESLTEKIVNISLKDYAGLRDRDDYHILESAISAKVDYLITGDQDLLVLKNLKSLKIISPEQYLSLDSSGASSV